MHSHLKYTTPIIAFLLTTSAANADQIDGNWCSGTGKSITVEGPKVTTPSGKTVTANYDRHHIDYEIPAGELSAGDRFSADQLNDDEISVSIIAKADGKPGTPEIWKPCKPIV